MTIVPVVDLSDLSATSLLATNAAGEEHGLIQLAGHGLDGLMGEALEQAKGFFDRPGPVLEGCRVRADSPFGFHETEPAGQEPNGGMAFDYGSPDQDRTTALNQWPANMPKFRTVWEEFHLAMGALALEVLNLIHEALALSPDARNTMTGSPHRSSARLSHHRPVDPLPTKHRSDPGIVTLILPDSVGSLQTRTRAGDWFDVDPEPGTIIVALGDVTQVWTNDRYVAAVYRTAPASTEPRFSGSFFLHPKRGARIEPIAELSDGAANYRPFPWRQYIQARNPDNERAADKPIAQLSDYRI